MSQKKCKGSKEIILQERAKKNGQEQKIWQPQTRMGAGRNEHADNINMIVAGADLDIFIPTIPDTKDADIIAKFKHKTLTKIKGKPTLESTKEITRQLGRDTVAMKVFLEAVRVDASVRCSRQINTWHRWPQRGMFQLWKVHTQALMSTTMSKQRRKKCLPSLCAKRTSKLWRQLGIY